MENDNTDHVQSKRLARLGLFIDEANSLRVLDAESTQNTHKLIQECNAFIESE